MFKLLYHLRNCFNLGRTYQVISDNIKISGLIFLYNEKFKKSLTNNLFFNLGYFILDFLITVSEISVPKILKLFLNNSLEIWGNPHPISNVVIFFFLNNYNN